VAAEAWGRRREAGRAQAAGTCRASAVFNACVSSVPVPIDDLLIHAEFVRAVARDLVRGAECADELTQQVWVAALRRPPRRADALRGWLATTARNVLQNMRRSERRRVAREQAAGLAAAPATAEEPAAILAREQVRERLVRAVLALDEPFRGAVLLHYYHGLPTPEIAARLSVPAATVRTRLARGLAKLRERLDADGGGVRGAWVPAMAGWASPRGGASVAADIAAGVAMKKVLFAAAAALLLLALPFLLDLTDDSAPRAETARAETTAAAAAGEALSPAPATAQRVAAATPATAAPDELPVFPADRGRGAIVGDVVDEDDAPIADVAVVVEPVTGTLPPLARMRDDRSGSWSARTDTAGCFRVDGVATGPVRLHAVIGGARRAEAFEVVADGGQEAVRLRARPFVEDLLRTVVVDESGTTVAGAKVDVYGWSLDACSAAEISLSEPVANGMSSADGVFELRGKALRSGVVFASTHDATGMATFNTWAHDYEGHVGVRVVLAPAASLRGVLTGPSGADADGVVSLLAAPSLGAYWSGGGRRIDTRLERGAFRFDGLPAGQYGITLAAANGVRLVVEPMGGAAEPVPNSAAMRTVSFAAGSTTAIDLAVTAGGRLRGAVQADGRPVARARVRAVLAPRTGNLSAGFVLRGVHVWRFDRGWEHAPNDPLTHVEATTDANGVYELAGLQPGAYRIEVTAPRLSLERRMDVAVRDGETTELSHELAGAGVIQFAAHDLSYVGVTPAGAPEPLMLAIVNGGFVTFPGLPAGRYHVARFHSDARVEPTVLATAEVVAGRTTWLDLRGASTAACLTGRVTAGGAPVAGAEVSVYPGRARTDAFGAFRVELGHRPTRRFGTPFVAVRQNGVTTSFELPDAADATYELGTRHVRITALDANGAPVTARVELSGGAKSEEGKLSTNVAVERGIAVDGSQFGPMPEYDLTGEVTFANGVRVPVSLPVGTDVLTVRCPATAIVRFVAKRADGSAARSHTIQAWTWRGEGDAPREDDALRGTAYYREVRADDRGFAELVVPAGESLFVAGYDDKQARRVRIEAGATATVELTTY